MLLVAAACRNTDKHDAAHGARATSVGTRGPDPILLRIPRAGGTARAYIYPKLDSVVWTGDATSIERVLGFNPEEGILAIVDGRGEPARIDLRLGEASVASQARLAALTSVNGTDIYGIDRNGAVTRLTRSGDWTFTPPSPARVVFPTTNGQLVVAGARAGETVIWRVHPPEARLLDTTVLRLPLHGVRVQVGDRMYFGTDTALVGVKMRDLSIVPSIRLGGRVVAVAPTPSGDRLFVANDGATAVSVVDRYTDKVAGQIELPGVVSELRMDPLGRYVLARPAHGDSAWVIAVATDRLVGSIETRWTEDLPACAPDGAIALSDGRDVIFVDGETLQAVRTVVGGASDFWYFTFWNGFRARAAGLDRPVSFSRAAKDSTEKDSARGDSMSASTTARDSATTGGAPVPQAQAPTPHQVPPQVPGTPATASAASSPTPASAPHKVIQTFVVSFAALLNEPKAQDMAHSITVNGAKAHVSTVQRAGTMVYRVVLGPYSSREAAEQAGRQAARPYWVYPNEP